MSGNAVYSARQRAGLVQLADPSKAGLAAQPGNKRRDGQSEGKAIPLRDFNP